MLRKKERRKISNTHEENGRNNGREHELKEEGTENIAQKWESNEEQDKETRDAEKADSEIQ